MSERAAVEALDNLGLANYEAQVFAALVELGTGTALDVHRNAGIARSQVYGTAEQLQEKGLIEIHETSPKQYKPVSLDAARAQLADQMKREETRAFQALETLRETSPTDEPPSSVSTVRGQKPIHERVTSLIGQAEDRILFGASDKSHVSEEIVEGLDEATHSSVQVIVVSEESAVRDMFDEQRMEIQAPPTSPAENFSGRVVLIDRDTVLLSVVPAEEKAEVASELALWTAETHIGRILVSFLWMGLQAFLNREGA